MPGVFLSHSSADKTFVKQLAVDLVNRGISVWFDSWELELGESLLQKIYGGIDNSSYLVVVLSSSSVESRWVQKELNAALAKEDELTKEGELHHPFVLPIKIDHCKVPLSVADRLYANFSDSYLPALEQLIQVLKRYGAHKVPMLPEQQLIPLSFTRGIYLQDVPLNSRIASLRPRLPAGYTFKRNQFVLDNPDEAYSILRTRFIQRMEHIAEDPYYTPNFERGFSQTYERILSMEEQLLDGIQLIINEVAVNRRLNIYSFSQACHWFARIIQTRLYTDLYGAQNPDREDLVERRKEWLSYFLSGEHSAQEFFGVEKVERVDIGPGPDNSGHKGLYIPYPLDSFGAWVDAKEGFLRESRLGGFVYPVSVLHTVSSECLSKYIVPQMVDLYLNNPPIPLTWDFEGYRIGIH